MKPLNLRFHSKHQLHPEKQNSNGTLRSKMTAVLCTLLVVGASVGLLNTAIDDKDTTVLSFPASAQLIEQWDTKLSMRLFELWPAEQPVYQQNEPLMLYPGGQPVGILLRTDGILVVGYSPIEANAETLQPAESAGIQAGDIITNVNGIAVTHDDELAQLINDLGAQGETITLDIQRQSRNLTKTMEPAYCEDTDTYRIGLLIRDNAGGVGTLTFVNPTTMEYGALGHMIANNETQRKLSILNGKLVAADIKGIKKGTSGIPGEKIGRFVNNDSLGSIDKNTSSGIFGTLSDRHILSETVTNEPLPVAYPNEIVPGSATIYTALDGIEVRAFAVEIEKVMPNNRDGKGLVIRVTDPELLERTGGIVQGMSGSPIIQNGKLIGAVTHVFINDPTRGYGILMNDMLKETSLGQMDATQIAA